MSYLALLQPVLSNVKPLQNNIPLLSSIAKFLLTFDARQVRLVGTAMSNILVAVGEQDIFPVGSLREK